jgi:hypothetical protein
MQPIIGINRGWEECCKMCWKSDRLDALGWAAIFIWGALVLLARTSNFETNLNWWDGWAVFFTGAGVIVLLKAVLRILVPEHRRPWVGDLICGLILLGFGLGDQVNWSWVWPVLLITIGLIILRRAFPRQN